MDNIPIRKTPSTEVDHLNVPDAVKEQLQRDIQSAAPAHPSVEDTILSEEFYLPSRGYFYSADSPLSSGKIRIKYMTAKEEDILSSENLIKKGIVLDYLIDQLIVTPGVKGDDLLITDKNALFIFARKLAYGSDYTGTTRCPACGAENEIDFDLDHLKNNEFDFSKYAKGVNEFEYTLPITKKNIKFKLLTGADEKSIREELKALSRLDKSGKSPEVTTRLKKMIISVDGKTDKTYIKNFVDTIPSKDSLKFRKHVVDNTPSLNFRYNFECEECGHTDEVPIPIDVSFFWPES